jgi:hypothetical protein
MNQTPPPADLSKLKGILGNAKNIMNKVNTGNFQTGNVDSTALVQDTSNFVQGNNVPAENQVSSMGNPARQMSAPNAEAIRNSKMPDAVKKAMLENPIAQPTINHTFNLDDVSDLIDEKPMPAPSAPRTQTNRVMNEQMVGHNNDKFTVSESALRGIIKDVLVEYLAADYSKNLTEGVIKKTINTLIKEGKIKTTRK